MSSETPCKAGVVPNVLTTFSTDTSTGLSQCDAAAGGPELEPEYFTSFETRASMVFSPSAGAKRRSGRRSAIPAKS